MGRDDGLYPLVDRELSRRFERAEGGRNAAFVEARAALEPGTGAGWVEVAGTLAMFDGAGSPVTQTFGLGMDGPVGPRELDALEAFFRDRGAEVFHEVSPLADPTALALLTARGYRPIEFTSLLFRPTAAALPDLPPGEDRVRVRPIAPGEEMLWAGVSAEGWGESPEVVEFVRGLGAVVARARGSLCYLAEIDGRPVGSAALGLEGGIALLAGASTIPSARNRGAQRALLRERLRVARESGCDLALMGAAPGSVSQRNAERQGFRIAYTRIKWQAAGPAS